MSELPTAPEWGGMLLIESGRKCHDPSPPREEMGCPSEHLNQMSEHLTAYQWDVGTPHCARTEWDAPHRIWGKCHDPSPPGKGKGCPQSIGMKCRNPSLRTNEVSELLTAPEWNVMLIVASEGKPHPLTAPEEIGCPSGHPGELSAPPPAPQ
jgi:hypothetical protein